ncbi:MAG: zinc ribbon domain-containing protein [Clostridia bacterium]|nr:zinc ribbon domain-containing protein [Clostridia bacterium]
MICSRCGTRNADNDTFCSNCGARLVITEPITNAESSVHENAKAIMCLNVMKKHFGSKLFLSAVIIWGIIFLLSIILSLPSLILIMLSGIAARGIIGIVACLALGFIPSILMFAGYVKIYNAAHKGEGLPLNTSGHKIIHALLTLCNVMFYISIALFVIIHVILLLIPMGEIALDPSVMPALTDIILRVIISIIMIFVYAMLVLYIIYFRKLKGDYKNLARCFESGEPFKGLSLYVTIFDIICAASMLFTAPASIIMSITSAIIVQDTASILPSLILASVATLPSLYIIIVKIIIRIGINKDLDAINSLN